VSYLVSKLISSPKSYIAKVKICILNVILVFNKPIHEGHKYTIILGKDLDLVAIDSFYCDLHLKVVFDVPNAKQVPHIFM
jgi:hypothetical protein